MKWTTVLLVFLMGFSPGEPVDWRKGLEAHEAGRYEEALRHFKTVAKKYPDWYGIYIRLGSTYQSLNRFQDAVEAFERAYELRPHDYRTSIALAHGYTFVERYYDAVRLLRTVDEDSLGEPTKTSFLELLRSAEKRSRQSGQELEGLRGDVALDPNNANLQYQFGRVALYAQETANAVEALEAAVKLDSLNPRNQELLIEAYIRQGDTTRGKGKKESYQKAVDLAEHLAGSERFEHLLIFGKAQLSARSYREALTTFENAHAKKPDEWESLYYQGRALAGLGEYESAEAILYRSLEKTSEVWEKKGIYLQLAFVLASQSKYNRAIRVYEHLGEEPPAWIQRKKDQPRSSSRSGSGIRKKMEELEKSKREFKALQDKKPNQKGTTLRSSLSKSTD